MMILEKMNFEEVINPHYAFPIVGVILCALLVFAFGFKTPVQPPSFDDFDEHRKGRGKKQKSREKPKVVLNGNTPQPKSVVNVRPQPEAESVTPTIASPAIEKPTKNDTKTKVKKSAVPHQQAAQPEVKQVTSPEDNSGGRWTQQLSKKDRKNRKKEEPQEVEKSSKSKNKVEGSPSKTKDKPATKEPVNSVEEVAKDDSPPPAVETKATPELAPKEQSELPKKKAAKTEAKPPPAADAPAPTQPETTAAATDQAKGKNKKEKKTEEVKATVVAVEPPTKLAEKPSTETVPDNKKSSTTEQDKTAENGSSNVAFDELGDAWQDSKPQKKKKKARRE